VRNPWDIGGRSQDEMESLQTDVMRFMAVLGLCLAAIFSLVGSPDFDPPSGEQPEIAREITLDAALEAPPPPIEVAPAGAGHPSDSGSTTARWEPLESSDAAVEKAGFTLEFESAESLRSLVDRGAVVLVISDGSSYWTWSGGESFVEAADVHRYYRMDTRTVPDRFRAAAVAKLGHRETLWGVVLPEEITEQIEDQVRRHDGGVLLISSLGTVTLEKPH